MAFGAKKVKPETEHDGFNEADDPNIEGQGQSPAVVNSSRGAPQHDFLNPVKDVARDFANDPLQEELTIKTAYQHTVKILNALKIVTPIITALMTRPGVEASGEELTEGFRHLIKNISNLSASVCEKMGVDATKEKNFWIRNVLEKNFAEISKEQWIQTGEVHNEKLLSLIDEVIKFSEGATEKFHYEDLPTDSLVKLAIMKAMMPLFKETTTFFNLYRDIEADVEPILTKLYQASAQAVQKLASDYAQPKDRANMFNILMQEAGNLYACAWHAESIRVQEIMSTHSEDRIQKIVEKYKSSGGFPLNNVDSSFDKYWSRVLVITQKLGESPKSGLNDKVGPKAGSAKASR